MLRNVTRRMKSSTNLKSFSRVKMEQLGLQYLLLREVESRPIIWGKPNFDYRDDKDKQDAWEEIFKKVFERYPFLTGINIVCC